MGDAEEGYFGLGYTGEYSPENLNDLDEGYYIQEQSRKRAIQEARRTEIRMRKMTLAEVIKVSHDNR